MISTRELFVPGGIRNDYYEDNHEENEDFHQGSTKPAMLWLCRSQEQAISSILMFFSKRFSFAILFAFLERGFDNFDQLKNANLVVVLEQADVLCVAEIERVQELPKIWSFVLYWLPSNLNDDIMTFNYF